MRLSSIDLPLNVVTAVKSLGEVEVARDPFATADELQDMQDSLSTTLWSRGFQILRVLLTETLHHMSCLCLGAVGSFILEKDVLLSSCLNIILIDTLLGQHKARLDDLLGG